MTRTSNICDFCGEHTLTVSTRTEHFVYGSGEEAVTLTAAVPVYNCASCDESFTGDEAEAIRHNTVCHHLGRLTPDDIRSIRGQYGLTQDDLAALSGIGIASIKRWEAGHQIQNLSFDKYLRLIRIPQNLGLLRVMDQNSSQAVSVFRTPISDRSLHEAKSFQLRPAVAQGTHTACSS